MEKYHRVVFLIVFLFQTKILLLGLLQITDDTITLGNLESGTLDLDSV